MKTIRRPVYVKPDSGDFFKKLQKEVEQKVLHNKKYQQHNIAKALILLVLYLIFYTCILLFGNNTNLLFLFYTLTGFTMIALFINAFHDAVHGALFKKPTHNEAFTYILELFGSNRWLWKRRHISLHHAYPNVQDWDADIKQSDLVRIFPNSPWLRFHRYQHIYMWLIYPLYTLNWLFIRDFKDFFGSRDNYIKRITTIPQKEAVRLIAAKVINIVYLIVLPAVVLHQPWQVVFAAWIVMHLAGSVLGVIALISTHVDEDAYFPIAENGRLGTTWAEHQMLVTKDFSTGSPVANFLFGGFTHHVAHHLFPSVGHTYYPYITPIIKRYAEEYNLPYTCYPFHHAVRSHFRMLRDRGSSVNIFATGDL